MIFDRFTPLPSQQELPIPRDRCTFVGQLLVVAVLLFFVGLALFNLYHGEGLLCSCTWLGVVTAAVVSMAYEEGGLVNFARNRVGDLFGRGYVAFVPSVTEPAEIRIGFRLLGWSFVQLRVPLAQIESVEWSAGQGTAMAGRDMADWHVLLWYDHGDPARSARHSVLSYKPDQELRIVGPSAPRSEAETLGRQLIAFLRAAGADLVPGQQGTCYVRRRSEG